MLGITPFGWVHTLVSLAGLLFGLAALLGSGRISQYSPAGKLFIWLTVASCISGFFIFSQGRFNEAHALGALTLLTLAAAFWLERVNFKRWAAYVSTALYTLALFFHFIPGFTESLTRLPAGNPLAQSPQDPLVKGAIGASFLVYLVVVVIQIVGLRSSYRKAAPLANKSPAQF